MGEREQRHPITKYAAAKAWLAIETLALAVPPIAGARPIPPHFPLLA